jgi:hypothetical protein
VRHARPEALDVLGEVEVVGPDLACLEVRHLLGREVDLRVFRVVLRVVEAEIGLAGAQPELQAVLSAVLRLEVARADRPFASDEIDAITRFVDKALTDRTGEPSRPKTVPSGLDVPIDGFRVPR